jgi:uracil-DNA glycosylase
MKDIYDKISEDSIHYKILPGSENIFNAFRLTNYDDMKIVILGQDPYPNAEDAHGLSFSSLSGKIPKSLQIIFEEIKSSLYSDYTQQERDLMFSSPNLTGWAKQGVLLLNAVLTVREKEPESHYDIGWNTFTQEIFNVLNNYHKSLVFMFWGKKAQIYMDYIDNTKHLVLVAPHPAAELYSGGKTKFTGCGHFFKAVKHIQEARSNEIPQMDIGIMDLIPMDVIVDRIYTQIKKQGAPNEFGSKSRNRCLSRDEAIRVLINWEETVPITKTIDWRTS